MSSIQRLEQQLKLLSIQGGRGEKIMLSVKHEPDLVSVIIKEPKRLQFAEGKDPIATVAKRIFDIDIKFLQLRNEKEFDQLTAEVQYLLVLKNLMLQNKGLLNGTKNLKQLEIIKSMVDEANYRLLKPASERKALKICSDLLKEVDALLTRDANLDINS